MPQDGEAKPPEKLSPQVYNQTKLEKKMSKTYQQHMAEVREDIASEGYEADICIYMDIAESLLFDPEFKRLAKKQFPGRDGMTLQIGRAHV